MLNSIAFHVFAIVNNTWVIIEEVYLLNCRFLGFESNRVSRSEISDHMGVLFNFFENRHTIFHSRRQLFTVPPRAHASGIFVSHILTNACYLVVFLMIPPFWTGYESIHCGCDFRPSDCYRCWASFSFVCSLFFIVLKMSIWAF